ncbi:AraC-like DNA-binding protein [Metabacillus crassostreae]|uniref:TniQ family protein n=1 Tax=Metabacillus crassostreae TaxID=929098 RepID=UPI0019593EFB|nr:AraC-like DNA-binding protein [Metabacillus crassostreae]
MRRIYDFEPIEHCELSVTPLYSLPPVDAKGKDVESLSSYVTRLANAHNLRINHLFNRIIIPKYNDKLLDFNSHHINGFGPLSEVTLSVLEDYTKQINLRRLTMSRFFNTLSKMKLLKPNRAWCPSCFDEMKSNRTIVYEKLIWNITDYQICTEHSCKIVQECRECKRDQTCLTTLSTSGYCDYCKSWLGYKESNINVSDFKENVYKSNQIEQIFNYYEGKEIDLEKFINSLRIIGNRLTREMKEANFDVQFSNFQKYYLKKIIPTISSLLSVSYNLGISLIDILECVDIEDQLDNYEKKYTYNYIIDYSKFRSHLEKASNLNEITSIVKLASELNSSKKTLRKHFPELTNAIKEKNEILWKKGYRKGNQYHHKNQIEREKIRKYLVECIESTDSLSIEKIGKNLNVTPQTLVNRFPELVHQIRSNYLESLKGNNTRVVGNKEEPQHDYDYVEVNKQLLRIFNSIIDEPFYLKEIAKEIGISQGRLKRNFSDIINSIKEKNEQIISTKKRKVQEERELKIIDTIKLLFSQGTYPSVETVDRFLDFTLNDIRYLKIWRATLKELGIEKKKCIK